MNGWVDAPPPRRGLGCFGRGCLILVVFAIVLGIACFAGMYWGMSPALGNFSRHLLADESASHWSSVRADT